MATATPAIHLLTLLHQYSSLHSSADDELKSSVWNITKARRGRAYQSCGVGGSVPGGFGGSGFSPSDVREELRARALLECTDDGSGEPVLVEEGSDEIDAKDGDGAGGFVLHLDGMEEARARRRQCREPDTTIADNKEADGLRRRRGNQDNPRSKGIPDSESNVGKWTSEVPGGENDDEERLRAADPLNLFGVPPPSLRAAQANSRSALAYYVEVANLAREIMQITNNRAVSSAGGGERDASGASC